MITPNEIRLAKYKSAHGEDGYLINSYIFDDVKRGLLSFNTVGLYITIDNLIQHDPEPVFRASELVKMSSSSIADYQKAYQELAKCHWLNGIQIIDDLGGETHGD